MNDLKKLQDKIIAFRDERDWAQFHTPKDLALSLALEASEVLECFQWKTPEEVDDMLKNNKEHLADEMGDVLSYLLTMAHDFDIDLCEACSNKIDKSAKKYPVEKSKGNHKKYTEL